MSANLLEGVKPKLASGATESDGIISIAANTGSERNVVEYAIPGQSALSANQTCHIGVSLRTASGGNEWTSVVVEYADSAGNANGVSNVTSATGDGAWHRHELSVVVPSGMHVVGIHFNQDASGTAIDFANPTLSYGSPVTLASDAHTPYATQDHVAAEYATKAHTHAIADVTGLQAALDSKANAAAVTPIANGGTGATTKDGARKNLGIATVADVAWTDLWKDTDGHYVRWACRNNVVYVQWKIPQTTTAQWKAGILPAGYRPSAGTVIVAAWTEGNRMAVGWVDVYGDVFLKVNSAQTDGTNEGSLSYPIF